MTNDEFEISRRGLLAGGAVLPVAAAAGAADAAQRPVPVASTARAVRLQVNGRPVAATVEPRITLLDYLRDRMHLTGTKKGCNEGACGTCTVLIDGARMNACLTLAIQCEGRAVTTIEGIATEGRLHPVQRAFIEHDAFQCGYCTPGQILSAIACIREGHATDADSVREWMSGNICRCAAYPQITAAVLGAAGHPES
ncbi:xanthine dehydrogenase YagT iron-sulfur-binding subunit [Sphingomonas zeicaulis]|uniref:(2Fe-2S)-binding protein n=1 Tax=Sphingomonas zeicaulis TaxID=1632740 RepID=UPI003D1F0C21